MNRIISNLSKPKLKPFFVIPKLETETGESIIRLLGIATFGLFLSFTELTPTSKPEFFAAFNLLVVQVIYASAALVCAWKNWFSNSSRRTCTTVLDQALFAAAVFTAGEIVSPFFFVPIVLTLGTGLRYGRGYAVLSAAVSSLLIVGALTLSPFWQQYPQLSIGLGIAICVIPFYVFRLTDRLAALLRVDFLTEIANRRGFEENLQELLESVERGNFSGALLAVDLDGFKKINDDEGHLVGDEILKSVAKCLRTELAKFGTPARQGGDEFAVVVNKVANKRSFELQLDQVLERIVVIGAEKQCKLSASIGVYYFASEHPNTRKFALKAADELVYLSKTDGKNRYRTSTGRSFTNKGELNKEPTEIDQESLAA